ncbi:MAG: protein-methionine-sulfoxide reductase catalytic subunit MsrP, partial [Caldilineales bacterium]|nr:protein-methionine-sulfoxide reductase catalytic subunit MsrP [Caldilineales bacterium]
MLRLPKIPSSEITPPELFYNRRRFLKTMAAAVGGLALAACAGPTAAPTPAPATTGAGPTGKTDELGDPLTDREAILNYNNYFEFSTNKQAVARLAADFPTSPWQVQVGGLVNKPRVFDLDDLRRFGLEERIYRLRCVEAWSMVIPWLGFPLRKLLETVEPTSQARYVRFEAVYDPDRMPGQRNTWYEWPYVEGL